LTILSERLPGDAELPMPQRSRTGPAPQDNHAGRCGRDGPGFSWAWRLLLQW
jgi:hypothetical protein